MATTPVTARTPADPASASRRCKYTKVNGRCQSQRIALSCAHGMCRRHCRATEGHCPAPLHSTASTRTLRASTPPFSAPTPPPSIALTPPHFAFDDPFHEQEQARMAQERRALDIALGWDPDAPPSPDLSVEEELELTLEQARIDEEALARREESDLAEALRLSAQQSLPFMPSPPPTASSSRLPLRALSASPTLPDSIPLPPRRRATAPSLAARAKPSPRLKITTQLNATWMANNGGPSTSAPSTPSPSQVAPQGPSTSVLHIRQSGGRRAFVDRRQVERFTLVFLTETGPRIISVNIADNATLRWPIWDLARDTQTQSALGDDLRLLDVYLEARGLWMGVDINHLHEVATDSVLILRRRNGPDDDDTIERFLPRVALPHLRYNLAGERAAVRKQLRVIKNSADAPGNEARVGRKHETSLNQWLRPLAYGERSAASHSEGSWKTGDVRGGQSMSSTRVGEEGSEGGRINMGGVAGESASGDGEDEKEYGGKRGVNDEGQDGGVGESEHRRRRGTKAAYESRRQKKSITGA
ncbi:hypothetical protein C8R46DRAFT_1035532 [Mycena filopes]|nr:hypothetical protein C8R46DRAFT_1035532 [Mycena filopes]